MIMLIKLTLTLAMLMLLVLFSSGAPLFARAAYSEFIHKNDACSQFAWGDLCAALLCSLCALTLVFMIILIWTLPL
jgi:hypothetical protein